MTKRLPISAHKQSLFDLWAYSLKKQASQAARIDWRAAHLFLIFCWLSTSLTQAQVTAPYCSDFLTKWSNPSWNMQGAVSTYNLPSSIATDSQGNVYVGDYFTIKKFNATGTLLATFGSNGSGNGQFNFVTGIYVDSQGSIYAVDSGNNRIQKLDASGQFVASYGSAGSGNGQFNRPHDIAVDSQGNMYITDFNNNRIVKLNASGQFIVAWGSQGSGVNQFYGPMGIDLDRQGNLYVIDSGLLNTYDNGSNRLVKLDSNGQWIATWGSKGTLETNLNLPKGVDVDTLGNVYVTDRIWVRKLDASLQLVGIWGGAGSADGQFNEIAAVALFGLNNIYVADGQNLRIQKFGCADCVNPVITSAPTNVTVATGQNASFAVAATGNSLTYQWQVDKGSGFTNLTNGAPYSGVSTATLSITNSTSAVNGYQYRAIVSSGYCSTTSTAGILTVTCATPVITAQPVSASVTSGQNATFSASATGNNLTYQWQVNTGNGFANLTNTAPYAGANTSTLSITGSTTALNGYQYQLVVSSGSCVTATAAATLSVSAPVALPCTDFIAVIGSSADMYMPTDVAVDAQGNIYVASMESSRVIKYSAAGQVLATFTGGQGNGQVASPNGVAVDAQGNLYIADTYNGRVQKIDANGQFVAAYNGISGNVQFSYPYGIALDAQGNIYVTDWKPGSSGVTGRVVKLNAAGQWAGETATSVGLSYPTGITVDAQGNLYVADRDKSQIFVFNPNLTLQTTWGTNGTGINQYAYPSGIANDAQGNFYVTDNGNNRVVKLSSSGQWLGSWGSAGTGNGEFNTPSGVTVDSQGNIYVTEFQNNRVQKFGCTGCAALQITAQPANASVFAGQSATFSVTATGTNLTYQWQRLDAGNGFVDLTNGGVYSGVSSATLTISGATTALSGTQYRVIVNSGVCSLTATAATLSVIDLGPGGPVCNTYVTKKMADGLSSDFVFRVFALTGPGSATVYAGTSEGFNMSTNGGQTFTSSPIGWNNIAQSTVAGVKTFYLATYNGLQISTDNLQTFTTRNTTNGLGNNYVRDVYAAGTNVYAATQGGLSISTDGGQTFTNKTTANGLVSSDVISVYAAGNLVYAITNNPNNYAGTTLHVSTDGGQTFTTRGPANGFGTSSMLNSAGANSLYAIGNTVYVGTYFGIYISMDGGQTFTARTTANGLASDAVSDIQLIGSTVYAATDSGLSISTDGGNTFTSVTTANGLGGNRLSDVYVTSTSIYVASQGGGVSFCPQVSVSGLMLTTSATPDPVCAGSSVSLSVSATGGTAPYSYTWTAPSGVTLSATNTSTVGAIATTAGVQTFTVTVADASNQPASMTTISVTVSSSPTVSIAANPGLVINTGQSTALTASGATSYTWSTGATTATISTGTAGTYSVTGVTGNCSATASVAVTVNTPTGLTLTPSASTSSVCASSSVNLSVAVNGGTAPYSYTWAAPSGVTLSATNTSTVSAQATVAGVQTFTVTVADAGGSPAQSTTVSVSVEALPTVTLTASGTLSPSNTAVILTATPGGALYQFSAGATQINGGNTAVVTTPGLYSVTLTTASGCSASATTNVTSGSVTSDLTLTAYLLPTVANGNTAVSFVVDVVELNAVATSGAIEVRVTKDAKMPLTFAPTAPTVGGRAVQNNLWTVDASSNTSYYILKTNQVIAAGNKLSIGFTGQLSPGATNGTVTVSSVIIGGSGGETRMTNNSDAEKLDYFR